MRNRHAEIKGSTITFKFQGKSGIRHTIDINDRRLARIIQRCQDIPGYELSNISTMTESTARSIQRM